MRDLRKNLVPLIDLPRERLEDLPSDVRVRLHERTELPGREAVALELAVGLDRRGARPLGDQRDLAEMVAGAERADLLSADLDLGVALANDEEADAALALLRHGLARPERTLVHSARDRLQLARIEPREDRDVLEELGRLGRHGAILLRRCGGLDVLDALRELLDPALGDVQALAADAVEVLA